MFSIPQRWEIAGRLVLLREIFPLFVSLLIYVCVCVYVYIDTQTYTYIHIHIHTHVCIFTHCIHRLGSALQSCWYRITCLSFSVSIASPRPWLIPEHIVWLCHCHLLVGYGEFWLATKVVQ